MVENIYVGEQSIIREDCDEYNFHIQKILAVGEQSIIREDCDNIQRSSFVY